MSNVIYKYRLGMPVRGMVELPEPFEILSVHTQRDYICIWVVVPANMPPRRRVNYALVPTGLAEPPGGMEFLGTVLLAGGDLVFHVYVSERTSHA